MLSLVRPRWFIPVHGERRHLQHHARLAHEVGILPERTLVCEDGDVVEVGEEVRHVDRIQAGMTFVDSLGIGDVGEVLRTGGSLGRRRGRRGHHRRFADR